MIAPITSNLSAKGFLTTYFLDKRQSKLPSDSVVLLYQLRTIDRSRLTKRISKLSFDQFGALRRQMMLVF
ncbi:TPA: hypothetical protein DGH83_01030 [Candidatus Peregrinibacteria bacterium]|nr:hypothetical protein [Candidatus Peregrinibacteria bacterium]